MGFEYGYTCPEINESIKGLNEDIDGRLRDLLEEAVPYVNRDAHQAEFIKGHVGWVVEDILSHIEDVRRSNKEMRKEAEHQIDTLENDIEDLKSIVEELEKELEQALQSE